MLHASLQTELKPVKQNIGKTWMVLPQDDQKDQYVQQVRDSFSTTLAECARNMGSHANLSLGHLSTSSAQGLAEKASRAIAMSILEDHCYAEIARHTKKAAVSAKNATKANATAAPESPGQFCIP